MSMNSRTKNVSQAFLVLLLLGVVFAVYLNSLGGAFIFDDHVLVENNVLIRELSDIPGMFSKTLFVDDPSSNSYRPLQSVSYAVDYFLWGDFPAGFHFGNVIMHLACVLLVFFVARRLFGAFIPSYLTALLFGVTPVNTACVSYISGRADILSGAFLLLSFFGYLRYRTRRQKIFLIVSAFSYLFASLSKEYAVFAFPILLAAYIFVFDRKEPLNYRPLLVYPASFLLYLALRATALSGLAPRSLELSRLGLFPRVFTSLKTLFIDLRILFFPYDLHFGRTTQVESSLFGSAAAIATVLSLVVTVVLLAFIYRQWRKTGGADLGVIFFGTAWFFGSMVPLLNFFPLQVFHADNWLYFPSVGVFMAFASVVDLARKKLAARLPLAGNLVVASAFLLCVLYGLATVNKNRDYLDEAGFYLASVKWRPNVKFYAVLGGIYGKKGDYDGAIKYSLLAIETNQRYPSSEVYKAYFNLGLTYMRLSEYDKAERAFKQVINCGDPGLEAAAREQLLYLERMKTG